jgi:signal transduction histidine kinase
MSGLLKQVVVQVSRTVPLQIVLIVPFVLQILGTVGLVGYFSFKNGQETVNDLASQIRRELISRIEGKLQTYTEIPHNINRLNASTFVQGKIDVNAVRGDFPLWQQIQIYPTVSDIYCADRSGSLLGVRRNPANQLIELRSSNVATGHKLYGYNLDRNGKGDQLVSQGNKLFDARARPWYKAAVTAGEPVWSEIYADFASQLPTITASTPVYNAADQSLLGVCATDVFLPSGMSQFLRSLKIGKTGSAFIVERSGRLVSSSTEEPIMSSGADAERLSAVESHNPTVRATASYLRDHFKDLQQIQSAEQLDFNLDGKRQLVQVVPFKDAYGLDWLIVTVLPESDFMGQIHQNTYTTILFCLAALVLGIIVCILTTRWITRPIVRVSQLAKALARGEWDQTVEVERSGDLGELAGSFNQMAHQMQLAFAEVEQQVAERTLELEQEQSALKQSEVTNQAIISAIPDLLIQMSQDGTYLKVVRSGNFQPFNPQQLKVGANVRDVLPPNIAQTRMEYTQQAIQTGELQVYEQRIVSEDQVYEQEVRIVVSGDGEVLVMIRDIRDRKQAEEASILEERNRMAREIHDTLAQSFTSIIVHLDAASQRITLDPNTAQSHLKTGRTLARSGLADARRSVEALRPQLLEEGDLQSALDRFAAQMFSHTSVQVVCEAIGEPYTLPKEVEANLLRIGQEALTNAFKYANASDIRVELRYERSQCVLQIKDNGQGFERGSLSVGRGFGVLGMTERAERIGAELTIGSHLGQGTEIIVRIQTP